MGRARSRAPSRAPSKAPSRVRSNHVNPYAQKPDVVDEGIKVKRGVRGIGEPTGDIEYVQEASATVLDKVISKKAAKVAGQTIAGLAGVKIVSGTGGNAEVATDTLSITNPVNDE